MPAKVKELVLALVAYNSSHIDQDVFPSKGADTTEKCGPGNTLSCAIPWLQPGMHTLTLRSRSMQHVHMSLPQCLNRNR